jgi:hypothetical protein
MGRRRDLGAGHVVGQTALPGMDWSRVNSRQPARTGDPLTHPDGCPDCAGTGTDITQPEPAGTCGGCAGTGWRS